MKAHTPPWIFLVFKVLQQSCFILLLRTSHLDHGVLHTSKTWADYRYLGGFSNVKTLQRNANFVTHLEQIPSSKNRKFIPLSRDMSSDVLVSYK